MLLKIYADCCAKWHHFTYPSINLIISYDKAAKVYNTNIIWIRQKILQLKKILLNFDFLINIIELENSCKTLNGNFQQIFFGLIMGCLIRGGFQKMFYSYFQAVVN